jgi:hypothetical protein
VLHVPANPAGIAWRNVDALRRRGVDAELAVYERAAAHPEADWAIDLPPDVLRRGAAQLHVVLRFAPHVDVFHFYGETLLPARLQFRALRLARRRGVIQLVAADVHEKTAAELAWTAHAPARIVDSYATARVVPDAVVVPPSVDTDAIVPIPPRERERPLVVVAPGTPAADAARVAAACEELGAELELLDADLHHEQAVERCKRGELVVDDLSGGWYSGFGADALALGKPVVACLDDEARRRTEAAFGTSVPIVAARRDAIAGTLRPLLADAAERTRIGAASRAYAELVHDSVAVADRLLGIYARL